MLNHSAQASLYQYQGGKNHEHDRIAIITTRWNTEVVEQMYQAASLTFQTYQVTRITKYTVPGSFELPITAKLLADSKYFEAIICLGCIIRGETRHNEYISQAVSDNLMRISVEYRLPVIFGVLTTENIQQALDRANGTHSNKGIESAIAALEMIDLVKSIR